MSFIVFSCRGPCPSRAAKHGALPHNSIPANVGATLWVFALRSMLRPSSFYDRQLLGRSSRAAEQAAREMITAGADTRVPREASAGAQVEGRWAEVRR